MINSETIIDWIGTTATVSALLVAAWQLRAATLAAGQTHAREAWIEYLRQGLANPDLGEEVFAKEQFNIKNTEDLVSGRTTESQRYLWFLSILMEACEGLIIYFPAKYWKYTIRENLGYHIESITQTWGQEKFMYSPQLCRIVEELIETNKKSQNTVPTHHSRLSGEERNSNSSTNNTID